LAIHDQHASDFFILHLFSDLLDFLVLVTVEAVGVMICSLVRAVDRGLVRRSV
jgi:hypothetical protein